MSYVKVPPGLTRIRVGKRIVYQSNPPGLRVKIWNREAFDGFKLKGRFSNIDREELDFSIKKLNEPEDMDIDETSQEEECIDVDNSSLEPALVQGTYILNILGLWWFFKPILLKFSRF